METMSPKGLFRQRILTDKERKNLLILDIIRKNGPISRTDISRITGFNIVTTSNYINHYLEIGLAVERELDASTGGRKPVLVSLHETAGFVLGLSLEKDRVRGMVADLECRLIHETEKVTPGLRAEDAASSLIRLAEELTRGANIDSKKIRGLAVALPGIVDSEGRWFPRPGALEGKVGSQGVDLGLEKHFQYPVFLENDSNAAVLAEKWLGLSSEVQHVLFLMSGVSCGVMIDGEIYRGATGSAGELEEDGSGLSVDLGLPEAACEKIRKGGRSSLSKLIKDTSHGITLETLAHAVKEGDGLAKEIIAEGARQLSRKIVPLVRLFNPETVVIGGGIEKCGALLLDSVKASFKGEIFEEAAASVKVIPSAFGEKAPLWGASGIVCREVFKSV